MSYTSKEVYELISTQNSDPIVKRKICAVSGQEFPIFQSDMDFYNKISPTFAGQKFQVPTPTLCPEERLRKRALFRNTRKLYKRTCDATGDAIVSIYSPDKSYKVYNQKYRRSDQRNPMSYGQDFDFSKTFQENFKSLQNNTPRCAVLNGFSENSDYCNHSYHNKNCYMLAACASCEDSYYCSDLLYSDHGVDVDYSQHSSHCYESFKLSHCTNCFYCSNCSQCNHCTQCENCVGCNYCIGCKGLVNQNYCINNTQVTKIQYEQYISQHNSTKSSTTTILPSHYNLNNQDSIGNYLSNSNKAIMCYLGYELDTSKYLEEGIETKHSMDTLVSRGGAELLYESHCTVSYNIKFSNVVRAGSNCMYCDNLLDQCENCFGCVGLKKGSYCIFNKQYTKEEYELTVSKIISHMQDTGERGEFFHPSLSPFGYNETVANEYFPLSRSEALAKGYKWQDNNYDPVIPEGTKTISWKNKEQSDGEILPSQERRGVGGEAEILKSIFVCEVSGRPYRIIKQELEFYRKHHLPLPRKHPDVRHEERMKLRPGRTLYLRNCNCCNKEMLSVYASDHAGTIYCEECYQKEIYS